MYRPGFMGAGRFIDYAFGGGNFNYDGGTLHTSTSFGGINLGPLVHPVSGLPRTAHVLISSLGLSSGSVDGVAGTVIPNTFNAMWLVQGVTNTTGTLAATHVGANWRALAVYALYGPVNLTAFDTAQATGVPQQPVNIDVPAGGVLIARSTAFLIEALPSGTWAGGVTQDFVGTRAASPGTGTGFRTSSASLKSATPQNLNIQLTTNGQTVNIGAASFGPL